jgi:hypothetical protein
MAAAKIGSDVIANVGPKIFQWAIVILAFFLILRLLRKTGFGITDAITNIFNPEITDVVDSTTPTDGTTAQNSFAPQAKMIADGQYVAMNDSGTDEDALFTPLLNLNGAQLALVFEKYGVKQGKNLFEWYAEELCDSVWCGSLVYNASASQGCETYMDQCRETAFMRGIWQKSGLPISF